MFQTFLKDSRIYKPDEILDVLEKIKPYLSIAQSNNKKQYYNIPCAFDIETSSFYELKNGQTVPKIKYERTKKGKRKTGTAHTGKKVAIMYEWTFGIFGLTIIGRTWEEFIKMLNIIATELELLNYDDKENKSCKVLLIYTHNLGYEFQFLRHWLKWKKVFSVDTREPVYALTRNGFEFRCSYILSGYSLENLASELRDYKIEKLVGYLDYSKIRHSKTILTEDELAYCVNDVKVVMEYIHETIERDGDITKIPLTNTGYVRRYCRDICLADSNYRKTISNLTMTEEEYDLAKWAFQGGFTHANSYHARKEVNNMESDDYISAYPYNLVAGYYPMSKGERIYIKTWDTLKYNLEHYCCLFVLEMYGVESKFHYESYISESKCKQLKNAIINNGRVVSADHLIIACTELDFEIIRAVYTAEKWRVGHFWRYQRGLLPLTIVNAILKLYKDKTTYKNVVGKELEYAIAKSLLNACYGMAITDLLQPDIKFNYKTNEWDEDKPKRPHKPKNKDDLEKYFEELENYEKELEKRKEQNEKKKCQAIDKYNTDKSRFLFYLWGVWCTAHCRRNLFTAILNCGPDYVYCDTDCVKIRNAQKHETYFKEFNNVLRNNLYKSMKTRYWSLKKYGNMLKDGKTRDEIEEIMERDLEPILEPTNSDGEKKCLGIWEFDGHYQVFKTLGSKRYLLKYSDDPRNKEKLRGKILLTVSGLNKQTCMPYLIKEHGETKIFKFFDTNFRVESDYTGKSTHTYIDEVREGYVTDYNGNKYYYYERSSVHMESAEYSLTLAKKYIDFIAQVQNREM